MVAKPVLVNAKLCGELELQAEKLGVPLSELVERILTRKVEELERIKA